MFYIGICDDEKVYREQLKNLCDTYFEECSLPYECIEFSSGEELLEYREHQLLLLFLDIEMGGMSGVEMLTRLIEADMVWRVVFVTSHDEMALEAFSLKTLGFVRKPAEYERIEKWLTIAVKENEKNMTYEYSENGKSFHFKLEELYYLEGAGSYTYLYLETGRALVSERLKCWEEKLKTAPLVRIHKSYLVNMLQVKSWEQDKMVLENGVELPVGRQYRKQVKEAYKKFLFNMMRERM